ncbi:hypothetical protein BDF21DRAFT_453786 [Thamnidium elegans]|nr:hypothetical protein BDF21DRAFT_453786 [Thamnidium elegans]
MSNLNIEIVSSEDRGLWIINDVTIIYNAKRYLSHISRNSLIVYRLWLNHLFNSSLLQIFPQNNDLVQNQWILAQKQWILVRKQWILMDKINPLKEIIYLVEFFILYWVKLFSYELTGSRNQDPQAIKITRSNLRVTINHNSVTTIAKDYK